MKREKEKKQKNQNKYYLKVNYLLLNNMNV